MFHLTMCGGSVIRLQEEDTIIVTICGSTEVVLPTLAEKMIRIKENESDASTCPLERRANMITIMGGAVWQSPTVAMEIEEMSQLRSSGLIPNEEMWGLWKRATEKGDLDIFETITIAGGAGVDKPSKKQEIDDMERICLRGRISK